MLFGKYNHVVETFATDTADYSFRVRILPGRVGGSDHFFDPHSSCPPLKIVSIDRIPVSDQKAWGGVFRKRLDQLLGSPGGGCSRAKTQYKCFMYNLANDKHHHQATATFIACYPHPHDVTTVTSRL